MALVNADPPARSRGRPRSESARQAILRAAGEVLADVGYDRLSIGLIAEAAGVGKATIYRWWPSKGAVIAAMLLNGDLELPVPPLRHDDDDEEEEEEEEEDVAGSLRAWIVAVLVVFRQPGHGAFLRGITSAAAEDPDVAAQLRAALMDPVHAALSRRLGDPRAAPVRAAADAVLGAMFMHMMRGDDDDDALLTLVDVLVAGLARASPDRHVLPSTRESK